MRGAQSAGRLPDRVLGRCMSNEPMTSRRAGILRDTLSWGPPMAGALHLEFQLDRLPESKSGSIESMSLIAFNRFSVTEISPQVKV
jgi:hypothetical protein